VRAFFRWLVLPLVVACAAGCGPFNTLSQVTQTCIDGSRRGEVCQAGQARAVRVTTAELYLHKAREGPAYSTTRRRSASAKKAELMARKGASPPPPDSQGQAPPDERGRAHRSERLAVSPPPALRRATRASDASRRLRRLRLGARPRLRRLRGTELAGRVRRRCTRSPSGRRDNGAYKCAPEELRARVALDFAELELDEGELTTAPTQEAGIADENANEAVRKSAQGHKCAPAGGLSSSSHKRSRDQARLRR